MDGLFKLFHFVNRKWTRADEAHLAAQHIHKLRKLIDACVAQEAAKRCDPWVILHFENRPLHFIESLQFGFLLLRIGAHGAEFPHFKWCAVKTGAGLPEQGRAR